MTITDLVQSIDGRLRAIQIEVTSLEVAKRALTNGAAPIAAPSNPPRTISPTKRPARKRQGRSPRTKSAKLTPETLEQLLTVSNGDGTTTSALAAQTTAKQDQVLALLRKLEAKGNVRRTGQRRGTRWHLIPDEDRIAARAAGLERAAKLRQFARISHKNSPKAMAKLA